MKLLCEVMEIQRSSFYNWKQSLANPSQRTKTLRTCTELLSEYHRRYPTHDHRWLNAKIRLDTGTEMTDAYALKCCRNVGIRSHVKHFRYRRPGETGKVYPNLLMSEMRIEAPGQCVVSCDFPLELSGCSGTISIFVDYWNYEIAGWSFRTASRSFCGPEMLPFPEQHPEFTGLMETAESTLYATVNVRQLMPMYSISMTASHAQLPSDSAAMEAISGWLRNELLSDFHPEGQSDSVETLMERYMTFFNQQRPLCTLDYLTPRQFREKYLPTEK